MTQNLYATTDLLEKLKAIASEGLAFAENPYDRARYEKLMALVIQETATAFKYDKKSLQEQFLASIGIQTPRCGSDAAVLRHDGSLLVLQRAGEGTWCLPCGWVDLGEDFAEAAVRETFEETGLHVTPRGTISLNSKGPGTGTHVLHQINAITLMAPVADDTQVILSHEHVDHRWIRSVHEIDAWFASHDRQAALIFAFDETTDPMLPIEKT